MGTDRKDGETVRILKHNEALDRWTVAAAGDAGDCRAYIKRLVSSSVLDNTRTFVAWYEETKEGRREVARGLVR